MSIKHGAAGVQRRCEMEVLRELAACAGPHPEEPPTGRANARPMTGSAASRRMDATNGLAAILRDAPKSALLRMRSEMHSLGCRANADLTRRKRLPLPRAAHEVEVAAFIRLQDG